jgi:hypothetical protein
VQEERGLNMSEGLDIRHPFGGQQDKLWADRRRRTLSKTYLQQLAEVRDTYLHRRVWFWIKAEVRCEGFVVFISDTGQFHILYGYDQQERPLYRALLFPPNVSEAEKRLFFVE